MYENGTSLLAERDEMLYKVCPFVRCAQYAAVKWAEMHNFMLCTKNPLTKTAFCATMYIRIIIYEYAESNVSYMAPDIGKELSLCLHQR